MATETIEQAAPKQNAKKMEQQTFRSLEEAKAAAPSDPRFRLYEVENKWVPGDVCWVWERVAMMAVGRAYEEFGAEYTLPEGAGAGPRIKTADDALKAIEGMDEEQREALLAQLGVKKRK